MSQAGFTPIQIYSSPTAAATPSAVNLAAGELAINTLDEKLYFKNSSGVVKLLASNAASATTFSAGTTGLTPSSATSGAVTLAGTLVVANGGTGVTSSTGSGSTVLNTSPTLVTPALGTPTALVGTNITGTAAAFNINGTVGATTPATGAFTALSATGDVTASGGNILSTSGGPVPIRVSGATTNYSVMTITNTGGQAVFGQENSAGGNNLIIGASGYDTIIRGPSGLAFSANAGSAMQARLSSTGLAVTGALSATGTGSSAGFQSTANGTNVTGSGVEVLGGAVGTVQAYNRTGGAYIGLAVDGLTVSVKASGTSIGVFTSTGLAVTGALSSTQDIPTLRLGSTYSNANTRNWAWMGSHTAFGDAVLRVSNLIGGDPNTAGATVLSATSTGLAVTGALSYTTTLTGGTGIVNIGSGQIYKDASGNVGIGTASPGTNRLSVAGGDVAFISGGGNQNTYIGTTSASDDYAVLHWNTLGNYFSISNQANANTLVVKDGNVLIGTVTDAATGKLQVAGDVTISAPQAVLTINSTTGTNYVRNRLTNTGGTFEIGIDNSAGTGLYGAGAYAAALWYSGGYPVVFGQGNAERMRIAATGNVLIGTTTDAGTGKLQVAGNVAVTGALSATTTSRTGGYTVATLPAGVAGDRAYVTDAVAPLYNAVLTGGGAVTIPVFRNVTVWVSA